MNNIKINYMYPIEDGFVIGWSANIGFGCLTVHADDKGHIEIESECLSDNDDKRFVSKVFEALVNKADIIE